MVHRRLNIKLAAWLIVGTVVFGFLVHVVHGIQVRRNAGALYTLAEQAEQAGDLKQASDHLRRYVKFRPDDDDGYAHWAGVVMDIAEQPEATRSDLVLANSVLETAVRKSPERDDLRRRLLKLQMSTGRNRDAEDHLRILLQKFPDDDELQLLLSRCQIAAGQYQQAQQILNRLIGFDQRTQSFSPAVAADPKNIDTYVLLADLLRKQLDSPELADQVIDQMVTVNSKSQRAYLERSRYHLRHEQLDLAQKDINQALSVDANDLEVLLLAAEIGQNQKQFAEARRHLELAKARNPLEQRVYQSLALLEMAEKTDPKAALRHVQQGLKAAPDSTLLLPLLADLQLRTKDLDAVQRAIRDMRKAGFAIELLDYYHARILLVKQQWIGAAQEFERLRPLMPEHPELVLQIDLFLGQCYESLGQPDRAIKAYQRALATDSRLEVAQHGADRMARALGHAPVAKPDPLREKVTEIMAQPAKRRNWRDIDSLFEKYKRQHKLDSVQAIVLKSELCLLRRQFKTARNLLEAAIQKTPNEIPLWLALANVAQRDPSQQPSAVIAVLDRAQQSLGPQPEFALSKAMLAGQASKAELKRQLPLLEKLTLKMKPESQQQIWLGFAEICRRFDLPKQAEEYLEKVAKAQPDNLDVRLRLFQLARQRNDDATMRKIISDIRQLVGSDEDSFYLYCEASRLAAQAEKNRNAAAAAQQLINKAMRGRPDWHELHLLQASLHLQTKRYDDAITHFYRALELGPPNQQTVRQLVQVLSIKGRFHEAQQALERIDERERSKILPELQAEIYLRNGDAKDALQMAREAIRRDPKSSDKHLWYGHVLLRAGQPKAAEQAIRRAAELDPKSPQAWLSLASFLATRKQTDQIQQVLAQAAPHLTDKQRALLTAQTSDLLKDGKTAEKSYLAALQADPDDRAVLRELAGFYLGSHYKGVDGPKRAERYVQAILNQAKQTKIQDEHSRWARRTMARLIASKGTYPDLERALQMIEPRSKEEEPDPEDLLLCASLLANRPEAASRRKAVRILEQLQSQGLKTRDQLLLAQLYFRSGNWIQCRAKMLDLLAEEPTNQLAIINYVAMLLEGNHLDQAQHWITKLQELAPKSPTTKQLFAQLLSKQGDSERAAAEILAGLPAKIERQHATEVLHAAQTLEQIQQYQPAERLLREMAKLEPSTVVSLAKFLGRHGNVEEAFKLLQQLVKQDPAQALQLAVETVEQRRREVESKYDAQIERWFQSALRANPNAPKVLFQFANFRSLQQRHDEVEKIYRQLLEQPDVSPIERAVVLNNLAFSLALRDRDHDAAWKAIQDAISIQGPTGALLDTRAMVSVALKDYKQAITDLNLAIADDARATRYFHLARAQLAQGDKQAAYAAFQESQKRGLTEKELSPLERSSYERLRAVLSLHGDEQARQTP